MARNKIQFQKGSERQFIVADKLLPSSPGAQGFAARAAAGPML